MWRDGQLRLRPRPPRGQPRAVRLRGGDRHDSGSGRRGKTPGSEPAPGAVLGVLENVETLVEAESNASLGAIRRAWLRSAATTTWRAMARGWRRCAKGVGLDRRISIEAPEMRHGTATADRGVFLEGRLTE
jgi:hypothetical protein